MNRKCMKTVPLCCICWSEMHGLRKEEIHLYLLLYYFCFTFYGNNHCGHLQTFYGRNYTTCFSLVFHAKPRVSLLYLLKSDHHHLIFQVVIKYLVFDYHNSLFYFPFSYSMFGYEGKQGTTYGVLIMWLLWKCLHSGLYLLWRTIQLRTEHVTSCHRAQSSSNSNLSLICSSPFTTCPIKSPLPENPHEEKHFPVVCAVRLILKIIMP